MVIVGIDTKYASDILQKNLKKYALEIAVEQAIALRASADLVLVQDAKNSFHNEGAIHGLPKWKDISKITKKHRRQSDPSILQDTGKLRNSVMILNADTDSVIVGSQLNYAPIHQHGGMATINGRRVNVPKRPFLQSFNKEIENKTFARIISVFKSVFGRKNG